MGIPNSGLPGPGGDLLRSNSHVRGLVLSHLRALEAESIHILREVASEFQRPVMLYSIGKDSSVLLRLAQKAFYPGRIPFPLLHVDTSYKFREMIEFRDRYTREIGVELMVYTNWEAIEEGASLPAGDPAVLRAAEDARRCWTAWRNGASTRPSAARGATRRSRGPRSGSSPSAIRAASGIPKNQRPELWNLFNSRMEPGESLRIFPLSNWTELDIWQYIHAGEHPHRAAVLRQGAAMMVRGETLIPVEQPFIPCFQAKSRKWSSAA